MKKQRPDEDFLGDPEWSDDDDPKVRDEVFDTMKYMGWTPAQLPDPKDREMYAKYLAAHATDKV